MYQLNSFFRAGAFHALVSVILLFCFEARSEQSVSFAWDPSPDTNVVGYLVEYGTTSGDYSSEVDVGTNTSATLSGLEDGLTYYIVVVAYDAESDQSAPSGEISVTVPGQLYIAPGANPGDPVRLIFPTAPYHWYELQAATTLGSWQTIWQTPVEQDFETVEYDDPSNTYMPMRFYRLILH
jgi:hypothetical protein